ncbi:ferredoxin-type protein NapF [Zoogloea sp.]|uniref:ferredoxin-type protein NapF n=1 Tax=Zoogloea sp. TaxID=49181 RepID=UPI0035B2B0B0
MDVSRRRFLGVRAPGGLPFRPPWSAAEDRFAALCTRCDACLPVCPTGLLKRGTGGYPEADFKAAACTFCGDCAQACPTGAIGRDTTQRPWDFGIRIDESCLAACNVECRVCGEICDAAAIRFRPRIGGVPLPEVDNTVCTGCGACLAPCPTTAIVRVALDPVPELP